ncbi:MAG: RNase P subunit p30 family protein [Nanoarchaeota archaeon]
MLDIIFPNENEKEFLETARSLGYNQLIFVYTDAKKVRKTENSFSALLVDENKVKQYKGKADFIIVKAHEDINRHSIEKMKPDIMFGFEESERTDTMHQRYSGLNNVLCELVFRNKVRVVFSFNSILNSSGAQRAVIFGRMMQNISLCRKYKVKTLVGSFAKQTSEMRSAKDLQSLFITLGMHPKEAKEAMEI